VTGKLIKSTAKAVFWEWGLNYEYGMSKRDINVRIIGAESGAIRNGPAHYHESALASVDRRIRLSNDEMMEVVRHTEQQLYVQADRRKLAHRKSFSLFYAAPARHHEGP
jgi:hypothetical protein